MKRLSLCPFPWFIKVYYSKEQASCYQGNKTLRGVCRTFSMCWHIIHISDPLERGENFATKRSFTFFFLPCCTRVDLECIHTHAKSSKCQKMFSYLNFKCLYFFIFPLACGLKPLVWNSSSAQPTGKASFKILLWLFFC